MFQFNVPGGKLRVAQVIYLAMIIAIVIYVVFAYVFIPPMEMQVFDTGSSELMIIQVTLGIVSFIIIIIGFFLPRGLIRFLSGFAIHNPEPLTYIIVRVSLFEAVGIFGLLLAIMGADTIVTLLFFLVSLAALVLTFPTREKWRKQFPDEDSEPGNPIS